MARAGRVTPGRPAGPSLARILPRERLFTLLDRGREGPAAWVAGPPGCGKTTLVASYLDHAALPSLWYQLCDGADNVAPFFYYLGLAPEEFEDGEAPPLPLFAPE